jgi:cyclomaltodextrinase
MIVRRSQLLSLASMVLLAAPAWAAPVTFRYQPMIGGVSSVSVAGSFNGWDAAANPLKDDDKDGRWDATIDVPAGRITYKFVVNGDQWMTDDNAAETEDDGFGGKNAVAVIGDKPMLIGSGAPVAKKKPSTGPIGLRQVTFKYHPETKPASINLAGTMNDWSTTKTPMTDPDNDGNYTVSLLLPPGSYQYKFVVDGQWVQDRQAEDSNADDGYGGKNSVINVDDRFKPLEVRVGDGVVNGSGLGFTQGSGEVNAMGRGRVEFTVRTHLNDVDGAYLVTWPGGVERAIPMRPVDADRAFQYWRAATTMPAGETRYAFRLRDGSAGVWLTSEGVSQDVRDGQFTFSTDRFPAFETPDWVKHGIIYQIYPDRFRNGDPGNDPDFSEWYYEGRKMPPPAGQKLNLKFQEYFHLVKDWNDFSVLSHCPWTQDGRDWMAFYGGDIAGVRQKLDYLKELGVTAIYFNPLFQAKSTHKYDAADFRLIDPHFGSNEEFKTFVKEAHAKGIRIILDIVYNHSGNTHWAFRDAVLKGSRSPTYDWYEFKQWPLPVGWPTVSAPWEPKNYYDCWWGFGDLPDLNFDLSRQNAAENSVRDVKEAQPNIALVNYLLDATTFWLKDMDCDGVRLDVANEVPFWFWKMFHQRVKSVKPDAYIVGELWGNASDYVRPDLFDAVMNYAFHYFPIERFICKGEGTALEFDATLSTGRLAYPRQAVEAQMNLISSHDKARFVTRSGNDLARLKLAALFQMTYIGAPTIYYGDEVALAGGEDPDNRRPFPWDWEKDPKRVEVRGWYKKLTALRTAHVALQTGDFRTLTAHDMVYAYARSDSSETFVVALNAGRDPGLAEVDLSPWGGSVKATDALTGATQSWTGKARIALEGKSGRVFRIARGGGSAKIGVSKAAPPAKSVAGATGTATKSSAPKKVAPKSK